MQRSFKSSLVVFSLLTIPGLAFGACDVTTTEGTQASGAAYRIYKPDTGCWNGNLVVYAHGYVDVTQPIAIPESQLKIGDVSLPVLFTQMGYAFAVSSYSTNGLAIVQGVDDLKNLVDIFVGKFGSPARTYIAGPSEGGLVTTLSLEQYPYLYNAGLPACGPIGDFQRQLNYFGDFRVIFDYFFPGVIPGSPVNIPPEVMQDWYTVYVPKIGAALQANPAATAQLLKVTRAPVTSDPATVGETVFGILWYNIFATNDAVAKLGGQPFDNHNRIYLGSSNDLRLNLKVQRFTEDPAAAAEIAAHYQTTGRLKVPAVTMHTLGDEIIPYWHEPLYTLKTLQEHSFGMRLNIPILAYGHCNFTPAQILIAFGLMVFKDSGQVLPTGTANLLPAGQRQEFLKLARQHGVVPR